VIDALAEQRGWNHRTIRTLLARLVEKGALHYEVDGNRYLYRPAVTRQRCVRRESRSFLEKVFAGDVGSLLVHFVQDAEMTPEDVKRLKQLLDEKKRDPAATRLK
jgi:BlaI family penicillinase repressor